MGRLVAVLLIAPAAFLLSPFLVPLFLAAFLVRWRIEVVRLRRRSHLERCLAREEVRG